jgi:hypothetical protein
MPKTRGSFSLADTFDNQAKSWYDLFNYRECKAEVVFRAGF